VRPRLDIGAIAGVVLGSLLACTDPFADSVGYHLSVSKAGTGKGLVTSDPAGVDCGFFCDAFFNHATSVTLTATPNVGSTFTGWSGEGCSGAGTCTVAMAVPRLVVASFTLTP